MIECPFCRHMNVPGADSCASCGQDLEDADTPQVPSLIDRVSFGLLSDPVGRLTQHEPITMDLDGTVEEAIKRMVAEGQGSVVVMSDGGIEGIFTERDFVYKVLGEGLPLRTALTSVMTRSVETVAKSEPIAVALHRMALTGCRHLPIIEDGACVGVVSVRDIIGYFAGLTE